MPETEEIEPDYTVALGKEATSLQSRFADFLISEEVGYNPATAKTKEAAFREGVRLAVALRIPFQASTTNRTATAEEKEAREAARAAKAEEKAAEKAAAKAEEVEEPPAPKPAKKAAPAKAAAKKAPAATPATRPAAKRAPARRAPAPAASSEAPF